MRYNELETFLCVNDVIFNPCFGVVTGDEFPLKEEFYGKDGNVFGEPIKYWGKYGIAFKTPVEEQDLDFCVAEEGARGFVIINWATQQSLKEAWEYHLEEAKATYYDFDDVKFDVYHLWLMEKLNGLKNEEKLGWVRYGDEGVEEVEDELLEIWDREQNIESRILDELVEIMGNESWI